MTQATSAVDSLNIVTLNTQPIQQLSAGEGAPGRVRVQDDYIAVTTAMEAAGQYWRMCRIPTIAKVKSLVVGTDAAPDSNSTQQLALDFSVIFSDSKYDGTQSALQNGIPTTANTGAVTLPSAYSSPNKLFGTLTLSGNNLAIPLTDILIQGGLVYNSLVIPETPLWELFGFVNGQGLPQDPGGFFDILVDVSTAAATAHACNMYMKVTYVE